MCLHVHARVRVHAYIRPATYSYRHTVANSEPYGLAIAVVIHV